MARSARFFLSRVVKLGNLDAEGVAKALRESVSIESRDFAWTIVNTVEGEITYRSVRHPYLAGYLAKYEPEAVVEVIDPPTHKVRIQPEPNMQRGRSLFVYFPSHAIFGHHHVWNEIRAQDFRARCAELIEAYHGGFFVECELYPVADYARFVHRLATLDEVVELQASVTPPNPLFSVFWADLKRYVLDRRLKRMQIREAARSGSSVPTTAPEIARKIEAGTVNEQTPAPIGDAAILMAADGYGSAEVTGRADGQLTVVKTKDNAVQLKLDADVTAQELAGAVVRQVVALNRARKLKH